MKTYFSFLTLLSAAALLLSGTSCKKTSSSDTFTKADMPAIKSGSTWRYQIADSEQHTLDTITLTTISSTTNGSTQSWHCAVLHSGTQIDTALLSISDTLVSFYGSRWLPGYVFALPNKPGDRSTVRYNPDRELDQNIISLSHVAHYTVPGHDYDVQVFSQIQDISDAYLDQNFVIARGVGLANLHYTFSSWSPFQRKGIHLIDYHL